MKKLLSNPFAVAILASVALFLAIDALTDSGSQSRPQDAAGLWKDDAFDDGIAEGQASPAMAPLDRKEIETLANALPQRDLFAPVPFDDTRGSAAASGETHATETYAVKGLWIQGDTRLAAIDKVVLGKGDRYRSATVESIESNGVWLQSGPSRRFLEPGESWTLAPEAPNAEPQL